MPILLSACALQDSDRGPDGIVDRAGRRLANCNY
jgi:hypothetical protein